ncbi:hypothetical protein GNI_054740 [Gregarina niphandrodes]|uniref:Uncharacterized protein n=1 Tax=Gregarina niphandrodes TaxID=110365 RepID=A0A023B8X9_GRENI|nr:hypothetical protein GNI_054740 [Gregarina niphandrodes]EZG70675.1 hypothetical protein GNI_054740 [Gregarina niphandrodes]|eukprot:XP_011129895.1 hypothetical protein GNI_054740 [Gregarina niphandrodes]
MKGFRSQCGHGHSLERALVIAGCAVTSSGSQFPLPEGEAALEGIPSDPLEVGQKVAISTAQKIALAAGAAAGDETPAVPPPAIVVRMPNTLQMPGAQPQGIQAQGSPAQGIQNHGGVHTHGRVHNHETMHTLGGIQTHGGGHTCGGQAQRFTPMPSGTCMVAQRGATVQPSAKVQPGAIVQPGGKWFPYFGVQDTKAVGGKAVVVQERPRQRGAAGSVLSLREVLACATRATITDLVKSRQLTVNLVDRYLKRVPRWTKRLLVVRKRVLRELEALAQKPTTHQTPGQSSGRAWPVGGFGGFGQRSIFGGTGSGFGGGSFFGGGGYGGGAPSAMLTVGEDPELQADKSVSEPASAGLQNVEDKAPEGIKKSPSGRFLEQKSDPAGADLDLEEKRLDLEEKRLDLEEKHLDLEEKHPDPEEKHLDPEEKHLDPKETNTEGPGAQAGPTELSSYEEALSACPLAPKELEDLRKCAAHTLVVTERLLEEAGLKPVEMPSPAELESMMTTVLKLACPDLLDNYGDVDIWGAMIPAIVTAWRETLVESADVEARMKIFDDKWSSFTFEFQDGSPAFSRIRHRSKIVPSVAIKQKEESADMASGKEEKAPFVLSTYEQELGGCRITPQDPQQLRDFANRVVDVTYGLLKDVLVEDGGVEMPSRGEVEIMMTTILKQAGDNFKNNFGRDEIVKDMVSVMASVWLEISEELASQPMDAADLKERKMEMFGQKWMLVAFQPTMDGPQFVQVVPTSGAAPMTHGETTTPVVVVNEMSNEVDDTSGETPKVFAMTSSKVADEEVDGNIDGKKTNDPAVENNWEEQYESFLKSTDPTAETFGQPLADGWRRHSEAVGDEYRVVDRICLRDLIAQMKVSRTMGLAEEPAHQAPEEAAKEQATRWWPAGDLDRLVVLLEAMVPAGEEVIVRREFVCGTSSLEYVVDAEPSWLEPVVLDSSQFHHVEAAARLAELPSEELFGCITNIVCWHLEQSLVWKTAVEQGRILASEVSIWRDLYMSFWDDDREGSELPLTAAQKFTVLEQCVRSVTGVKTGMVSLQAVEPNGQQLYSTKLRLGRGLWSDVAKTYVNKIRREQPPRGTQELPYDLNEIFDACFQKWKADARISLSPFKRCADMYGSKFSSIC